MFCIFLARLGLESDGSCCEVAAYKSAHKSTVNSVSQRGNQLITCSTFDTAILWKLDTLTIVKQLTDERLTRVAFSDDRHIVENYRLSTMYVFDAFSFSVKHIVEELQMVCAGNGFGDRIVTRDCKTGLINLVAAPDMDTSIFVNQIITIPESTQFKKLEQFELLKFIALDGAGELILIDDGGGDQHHQSRNKLCPNLKFSNFIVADYTLIGLTVSGDVTVFDLRLLNRKSSAAMDADSKESAHLKSILLSESNRLEVRELAERFLHKHHRLPQKYRFYLCLKSPNFFPGDGPRPKFFHLIK